MKLTFFDLKKSAHSDKINAIFIKYVHDKVNVCEDTFPDFADISTWHSKLFNI